jgi:hypothetical protein
LRIEEEVLKGDTGAINQRLSEMEEKHELTKMKQEEAILQKKTFEHMLDRMKVMSFKRYWTNLTDLIYEKIIRKTS